jgi:DNA-binding NarL/FixJ family response regulator
MEDFAKKDMIPAGDDFNGYGFTDREKEVCRLLLDGYTLRQIASILKLACGLWHGNKGSCRIDDGEDL